MGKTTRDELTTLPMPHDPTPHAPDDETLARRAQQGCAASFEELVRRHQVALLHFLRQGGANADAEDLVQETFVRAYQNLDRYQPRWCFSTWLFTIARRLSLNQQRRHRPTADAEALRSIEAATPDPSRAAVDNEGRRRLWDSAAEVLNEDQYAAVWLYYVEDMPVKEIAKVLGRFTPAVKTMLFRARKALARRLASEAEATGDDGRTGS